MRLIRSRVACGAHRLQGGVASSAALAYLLAVIMAQAVGPAGRAVQGVLAAPAWAPLSDLSYSAYLYHVQVRTESACISSPAAYHPHLAHQSRSTAPKAGGKRGRT